MHTWRGRHSYFHPRIKVVTVDSGVVIIALFVFFKLQREKELDELWIEFGVGKFKRWIPIHRYAEALGENVPFPCFHWVRHNVCWKGEEDSLQMFWKIMLKGVNCNPRYALYLLRTSSSDPVSNVIMNHHQKSFQTTVYNMTVFEKKYIFFASL